MCPQMVVEGAQSAELFFVNFASMRLLSRVHHAVLVQGKELRETLVANAAFVRTFARVRPQMDLEVAQLAERLIAKFALGNQFSVFFLQRVRMRPDSDPSRRTTGTDRG